MYDSVKAMLSDLLRIPTGPPEPPAGTHASMQIFRAAPNYLRYQILVFTLIMVAIGIALFVGGIFLLVQEPIIGSIALAVLSVLWFAVFIVVHFTIRIEYDMRYYIVTDRSLRIRTGVWKILEQTLTFVNIQNITVEQGPISRLFGLSHLLVYTAGGGGSSGDSQQSPMLPNYHCAILSGLENATEIRDLIIRYLKKLPHSSGLGIPGEDSHGGRGKKGFSPAEMEALREILAETRSLRSSLSGGSAEPLT